MGKKAFLWAFLVSVILAPAGMTQHAELDPLEATPSDEAYQAAIRLRGIDTEVLYFDPTRPPPPLETDQPVPDETQGSSPDAGDVLLAGDGTGLMVVSGLILLGLLTLAVLMRGGFAVSFARDPMSGAAKRPLHAAAERSSVPVGLEAILAMSDRKAALIALCKSLLARVMQDQGVLLNKSWTDRDTLRRVPQDYPQRDALRELIFASERVQFGGRDVTEEEFRAHVARLKPLWTGASA